MTGGPLRSLRRLVPTACIVPTAFIVLAACIVPGCVSDAPAPTETEGADVVIDMTNQLTFSPATASARVGETVTWTNTSSMVHTVTADPELAADPDNVRLPPGAEPFRSPVITAQGSFRHSFTVPGTYRYFCQPHEGAGMIGVVIVSP